MTFTEWLTQRQAELDHARLSALARGDLVYALSYQFGQDVLGDVSRAYEEFTKTGKVSTKEGGNNHKKRKK